MATEDLLRLAWEAEHDGRPALRDAALTLAVTESRPEDPWAARCRNRLVAGRPNHYLAEFASVDQARDDPRVVLARDRLRKKYPEARVQWLLLRAAAARGPYTGRPESLEAILEDLTGSILADQENVRADAPEPARGPMARKQVGRPVILSLAYPPMSGYQITEVPSDWNDDVPGPVRFDRFTQYYAVLFAIAMLLASLPEPEPVESING